MDKFMARYVEAVLNEFKEDIKVPGNSCLIQEFDYSSGMSPDYSNITLQRLYLLRYFCAYICEYYHAYQSIIASGHVFGSLNVFSVGCGCGIDYYALHFAAQDKKMTLPATFSYSGVDIISWISFYNLGDGTVSFFQSDFMEWKALNRNDYNVLVFPKSIGEFSDAQFETIIRILNNTPFSQKSIVIVNSLRKEHESVDAQRTIQMVAEFKRAHKFKLVKEKETIKFGEGSIRKQFPIPNLFDLPSSVSDFLEQLPSNLNCIDGCGQHRRAFCNEKVKRMRAMTNCSYLMYDIAFLSR